MPCFQPRLGLANSPTVLSPRSGHAGSCLLLNDLELFKHLQYYPNPCFKHLKLKSIPEFPNINSPMMFATAVEARRFLKKKTMKLKPYTKSTSIRTFEIKLKTHLWVVNIKVDMTERQLKAKIRKLTRIRNDQIDKTGICLVNTNFSIAVFCKWTSWVKTFLEFYRRTDWDS